MFRLFYICFFLTVCVFAQQEGEGENKGPKGSQERWELVFNWLKEQVPSIHVDPRIVMRPGRFGDQVLSAGDSIKKGEFLLQLPVETFFWEEECFPSEEVAQLETGYKSSLKRFPKWKRVNTEGPDYTQVALCLLIHRLLGNESVYEPYIRQLPKQRETFMYHASEEFQLLRGTDEYRTIRSMQNRHSAILNKAPDEMYPMIRDYLPSLNLSDAVLREAFEECLSLCGSRTFHMDSRMLAPEKTFSFGTLYNPVMVPLIDFVNHGDTRTRNCLYYFNRTYQHFQLQTSRDIEPGEELVMSYGLRANWELVIFYGFIMPGNLEDFITTVDIASHALDFNFRLRLKEMQQKEAAAATTTTASENKGEKITASITTNTTSALNSSSSSTNINATDAAAAAAAAAPVNAITSLRCFSPFFSPSGSWPPSYEITVKNASPDKNNTPLSLGPLSPSIYYSLFNFLRPPHNLTVKSTLLAVADDSPGTLLRVLGKHVSVVYRNGTEIKMYDNESLASHGDLYVHLLWKSPSLPSSCGQSPKTASPSFSAASSSLCKDVVESDHTDSSTTTAAASALKCTARDQEEELREDFRLRRRIIHATQLNTAPDKIFRNGLMPPTLAAIKIAALPSLSAYEIHRILGGGKQLGADLGVSRTLTVFCFEELSRRLQVLGVETDQTSLSFLLQQARSLAPGTSEMYEQLARNNIEILSDFCSLIADWEHPLWE